VCRRVFFHFFQPAAQTGLFRAGCFNSIWKFVLKKSRAAALRYAVIFPWAQGKMNPGGFMMKYTILIALGTLAVSTSVVAQTPDESIERALAAAPRQLKEGATVIQWKADNTYDTLKKGTNRLLCYDRSGEPGRQPFAVQCTSIGNLDRVAQNRKFEAMTDKDARQKALDAAEANGTRIKPEYGSVWYDMNGADQSHARIHVTIAVPGATTQTTGLPDNPKQGGVWIMNAGTSTAHIMTPGS
jgi:hypothetical protein